MNDDQDTYTTDGTLYIKDLNGAIYRANVTLELRRGTLDALVWLDFHGTTIGSVKCVREADQPEG